MDPFEEFEIKPLSDGLGFHKKAVPLAEQIKKSGLIDAKSTKIPGGLGEETHNVSESTKRPQAFDDLLKALEAPVNKKPKALSAGSSDVLITEPLPAPNSTSKKKAMEIEIPRPVTPEFPNLNPKPTSQPLKKVVENVGIRRGANDSPVRMLERAPASAAAAILDGVVIFALSLVFLVALMTITKVDIASLIFKVGLDVPTKIAFFALFVSVMMMYVVVIRSFFGRTLGEWTFDFQMGNDQQHESVIYPFQVLWRCIVTTLTGVVVLPILSMILKKDLLAPVSGLQLYRSR